MRPCWKFVATGTGSDADGIVVEDQEVFVSDGDVFEPVVACGRKCFVGVVVRCCGQVVQVEMRREGQKGVGQAEAFRNIVIGAMEKVRAAADRLELIMDADLWPLPTYAEMLFVK